MRIKTLLLSVFIVTTFSLNAKKKPMNKVWDLLLNDVKIRYTYSLEYNALQPKPKFGKQVQELDGKTIIVKGFFLPLDVTGNIFVLSYNPMNMCFFCTGNGLQTIIELNVLPEHLRQFNRLRTDNYFEVKGKLRLNSDLSEHLIYVLDDVEFVRLIK